MIHGEKFFTIEENQASWDNYLNNIMYEWDKENRERLEKQIYTDREKEEKIKRLSGYSYKGKDNLTPYKYEFRRKKQSVQQYKPILLEFEQYVGKSFNEITAKDIEEFSKITTKANKLNHLNAFFCGCISSGVIKNRDKDFLISLLPDVYKNIGEKLAGLNEGGYCGDKHKGKLKCPFCGRHMDALSVNWVLIQYENESEKYLACIDCKGNGEKYEN